MTYNTNLSIKKDIKKKCTVFSTDCHIMWKEKKWDLQFISNICGAVVSNNSWTLDFIDFQGLLLQNAQNMTEVLQNGTKLSTATGDHAKVCAMCWRWRPGGSPCSCARKALLQWYPWQQTHSWENIEDFCDNP